MHCKNNLSNRSAHRSRWWQAAMLTLLFLTSTLLALPQPAAAADPGAALDFDGVNDYVSLRAFNFNSTSVTLEAWIKPVGIQPDWAGIIVARDSAAIAGGVLFRPNNELGYMWNGNYWWISTGLRVPSNQWSYVALVVQADKATLYLNNRTYVNTAPHPLQTIAQPFQLGTDGNWNGRSFKGSMDGVRVWRRALSQSEIQARRSCELASAPTGLVARYNFNQGTAQGSNSGITSLTDGSGNNANGTLTNFALTGTTSNWVAPSGVTAP